MEQHTAQTPKDEIDLGDVVKTLWQGKWLIAGVTCLCMIFGVSFALWKRDAFTAKLEILPLTVAETSAYAQLNTFKVLPTSDTYPMHKYFSDIFISELVEREGLIRALADYKYLDPVDYDTEQDYNAALVETAFDLQISRPPKGATFEDSWLISFNGVGQDKFRAVLGKYLQDANETARQKIAQTFLDHVAAVKRQNIDKTEEINAKISRAREIYDINMQQRLAFLQEQAQIARDLGVADGTVEAQYFGGYDEDVSPKSLTGSIQGVSAAVAPKPPFYARGYRAIESEIVIIKNRTDSDLHIPELIRLRDALRAIEQDRTAMRVETALAASPIGFPDIFKAARVNLDALSLKPAISSVRVLIAALIFGVIFGSAVVLLRSSLSGSKN